MHKHKFVLRTGAVLALAVTLAGCSAHLSGSRATGLKLQMTQEDCEPTIRDRPGQEIVQVALTAVSGEGKNAKIEHQFMMRAVLPLSGSSKSEKPRVQRLPFQAVSEMGYVSGAEFTTHEENGTSIELSTSMLASGIGGMVSIYDKGDAYNMRIKYRDAVVTSLNEIPVEIPDGGVVTIQSPEVSSVNRDAQRMNTKNPGMFVEFFPGAEDRQIVVQRCWFKVPSDKS